MANANTKVSEIATTVTTESGVKVEFGAVSPAIVALAAAQAAKKADDEKARAARKAVNGAQTQAREILGAGISDLAKLCRRFVASQGPDAAERTSELVKALHQAVLTVSK